MPPYSLDIIYAGPLGEWPGPKKVDLKAFITSAVNGYAAWLYEEYDIEFYSAVIRYDPSNISFGYSFMSIVANYLGKQF